VTIWGASLTVKQPQRRPHRRRRAAAIGVRLNQVKEEKDVTLTRVDPCADDRLGHACDNPGESLPTDVR
jgi:hypothetical protein